MCNLMSLKVVNLDNRPFYTVVKQIIKKAEAQKHRREGGWICEEAKGILIFTTTCKCKCLCVGWENCVEIPRIGNVVQLTPVECS